VVRENRQVTRARLVDDDTAFEASIAPFLSHDKSDFTNVPEGDLRTCLKWAWLHEQPSCPLTITLPSARSLRAARAEDRQLQLERGILFKKRPPPPVALALHGTVQVMSAVPAVAKKLPGLFWGIVTRACDVYKSG
jgi:hypothetical protein